MRSSPRSAGSSPEHARHGSYRSRSAFLGLPSLHSIIQAIAGGFFGALAGALVPSWLKHGTIATIQQLVALPDPASWTHVGALQSEMTYLGAMLAPVTLTVGALRYWAMGLTGSAHPVSAVTRCARRDGGARRPTAGGSSRSSRARTPSPTASSRCRASAGGLQRIIGVLFGGALLSGAGGVFGAFLVIVGVVFAAGLFAAQVLLTVVLALLIVAGPPLIALAAIPELAHLARMWRDALLAVALIPLGWTVLFATAGALCLDATSFTGGARRATGSRRRGVRGADHVLPGGEASVRAARGAARPAQSRQRRRPLDERRGERGVE